MHEPVHVIEAVVFDLGGVLVDWNPRHLFRKIFVDDEAAMEAFLANVCNTAWNESQDRGRSWAAAIEEAVAEHPAHEAHIRAYRERWEEMLAGALDGTVQVLDELHAAGVRLIALTNWSAETFHYAEQRFAFLKKFEGVLVSGRENLMKPEAEIFQLLLRRYGLEPSRTLFIDDVQKNVDAAKQQGMQALRFVDAQQLRQALVRLGLPGVNQTGTLKKPTARRQ
jgi:2-haloacid dehalogenase